MHIVEVTDVLIRCNHSTLPNSSGETSVKILTTVDNFKCKQVSTAKRNRASKVKVLIRVTTRVNIVFPHFSRFTIRRKETRKGEITDAKTIRRRERFNDVRKEGNTKGGKQ